MCIRDRISQLRFWNCVVPLIPGVVMAYDEGLADQIRAVLSDKPHMVAKKMFGGLGLSLIHI